MRITPDSKYEDKPCSYVAVGCAYEDIIKYCFHAAILGHIKEDGYMTLDEANKFIREFLPVRKKVYYKRTERMSLKDFLKTNEEKCCVCTLGHYIYVDQKNYWSFFDNENDPVVCVWYLRNKKR